MVRDEGEDEPIAERRGLRNFACDLESVDEALCVVVPCVGLRDTSRC